MRPIVKNALGKTHYSLRDDVTSAVKNRYGTKATLKMCMWECEDTVLVNLSDDLDDKYDESDLLTIIKELLG